MDLVWLHRCEFVWGRPMWESRQQTLLLEEEALRLLVSHTLLVFPPQLSPVPFFILKPTIYLPCWSLVLVMLLSCMTPVLILERRCVFWRGWHGCTAALGFDRRVNEFCCVWLSGQSGGQFDLNRRNGNCVSVFSWAVVVTVGDSRTLLCLHWLSQTTW